MNHIDKTYTVWTWNDKQNHYRVGRTFKGKMLADDFISKIPPYLYIGTTISFEIHEDDIA